MLRSKRCCGSICAAGQSAPRVNLRRAQVIPFFGKRAGTVVAMEACGGSHHWARELTAPGHEVRLIPPQYVKPFVKRGKNDRNDAEAICEAASRPGMRLVLAKTEDQQAEAMVLKVRTTLVEQRTQLINALRGHAAEFGLIAAQGTGKVAALLAAIETEARSRRLARRCWRCSASRSSTSTAGSKSWKRSSPRRTRPMPSASCWRPPRGLDRSLG
jgi:transposase